MKKKFHQDCLLLKVDRHFFELHFKAREMWISPMVVNSIVKYYIDYKT